MAACSSRQGWRQPRPEAAEGFERTVLCSCTLSKPIPAAPFPPPAQSCHPQGVKCVVKLEFKGSSKRSRLPARSSPPQQGHCHKPQENVSWSCVSAWEQLWVVPSGHQQLPNHTWAPSGLHGDLWHLWDPYPHLHHCRKHLPKTSTNPINR